jgi:hypothetical protein
MRYDVQKTVHVLVTGRGFVFQQGEIHNHNADAPPDFLIPFSRANLINYQPVVIVQAPGNEVLAWIDLYLDVQNLTGCGADLDVNDAQLVFLPPAGQVGIDDLHGLVLRRVEVKDGLEKALGVPDVFLGTENVLYHEVG